MADVTPFDSMRFVTLKEQVTESQIEALNPFMVNRGFSMDKQYVLYADAVNRGNWSPKMIHDFYTAALPKRKFFAKWAKAQKTDEDVNFICQAYSVNKRHASEILDILTPTQLSNLKHEMEHGGKDKQKQPKS